MSITDHLIRKLAFLLLVLFGACGVDWSPIVSGTILDKKFEAEHWEGGYESEYTYDCGWNYYEGEYECGWDYHDVWEDHHSLEPDWWGLYLHECKTKDDGKQKCRDGWVEVTRDEFGHYEVGHHYPDPR